MSELVGFVPEDLREVLSRPLPHWAVSTKNPKLKVVSGDYYNDEDFANGNSSIGVGGKYTELFTTVARLGEISCSRPDAFLQVSLAQGPATEIGRGLQWHTDTHLHYGRLVVSDSYGTLRHDSDEPTPDYGILKIDEHDIHSPNMGPANVIKTRLQVTLMRIHPKK